MNFGLLKITECYPKLHRLPSVFESTLQLSRHLSSSPSPKEFNDITQKQEKGFIDLDAEKLTKFACINYFVDAEKPGPEILPDSEYPAWLFEIDLREPRELEDLDPTVDKWIYWRAFHKRQREQASRLRKLEIKSAHLQTSNVLRKYMDNLGPRR